MLHWITFFSPKKSSRNKKMAGLLYVLCFLAWLVTTGNCQCRAAEESTAYNITGCTFTPTNATTNYTELRWMAVINNTATTISSCSPDGKCNSLYPGFTAKIDNNKSYMTIENVSRLEQGRQFNVETTWSCQWSPLPVVNICSPLRVYARPKSVICDLESLNAASKQVSCTIDQVFPVPGCTLLVSRDNQSYGGNSPTFLTSTNISQDKMPVYYRTNCTFTNLRIFYIGKNYVKLSVTFPYTGDAVYSKIVLIDLGQEVTSTTQEPTTQKLTTSQTVTTIKNVESDSSIAIGLGVTTAILACAVVVLSAVIVYWWLKHKRKGCCENKKQMQQVPEGYDRAQGQSQTEAVAPYAVFGGAINSNGLYVNTQAEESQRSESGGYINLAALTNGAAEGHDNSIYEN